MMLSRSLPSSLRRLVKRSISSGIESASSIGPLRDAAKYAATRIPAPLRVIANVDVELGEVNAKHDGGQVPEVEERQTSRTNLDHEDSSEASAKALHGIAIANTILGKPMGVERLATTTSVAYDWDYTRERSDLRTLYEKSKDLMWNVRTDLDWETDVDPERELVSDTMNPIYGTDLWNRLDKKRELPNLRRHMASYMLSNFLHGEQGALLATSQILAMAEAAEAKFYASAQVFDEARHVEAYDRYLKQKIELVYPPSPHLKRLLDTVLTDSRWDFKFLGMQILIEGVALGAFGLIHQTAEEPLIKQITHLIMQDEARHVAFGVMSLKGYYDGMNESELRDREEFILESSRLLRDRFLAQEVWASVGLPQAECEEAALDSVMMKMFRRLLFSKIVPNVKRLGLLTPRVRNGFAELGILEYESWEPSA